jgi:hypothetical protein
LQYRSASLVLDSRMLRNIKRWFVGSGVLSSNAGRFIAMLENERSDTMRKKPIDNTSKTKKSAAARAAVQRPERSHLDQAALTDEELDQVAGGASRSAGGADQSAAAGGAQKTQAQQNNEP